MSSPDSTFIEARLLDCVSYGSGGGPTWATRQTPLKNGIVRRNPRRTRPLYKLSAIYKNISEIEKGEIEDAFNAAMGGCLPFRYKDWQDFDVEDEILPLLGTGSSQSQQLIKAYSFGSLVVQRPIRKPVHSTVVVKANGVPISATITSLGVITYTASNGSVITWTGEFDVPVYFQDDELNFTGDDKNESEGFFYNGDVTLLEDLSV